MRSKGVSQSFKRDKQEPDKNGLSYSQPRGTKYKSPMLIGSSIGNSCKTFEKFKNFEEFKNFEKFKKFEKFKNFKNSKI